MSKGTSTELPMNTVVILVVLLVVLLILLVLLSRGGEKFMDLGGDKINVSSGVTECQILCFECCRKEPIGICDHIPTKEKCGCIC